MAQYSEPRLLLGWRFGVHQFWLPHRRTSDLLIERSAIVLVKWLKPNRLPAVRRPVDRTDHPHVRQTLVPRRFRCGAGENAVREMDQFRRELIALGKTPLPGPSVNGQPLLQLVGVFVRGIHQQLSLAANHPVHGYVGPSETAAEAGEALLAGEAENSAGRFLALEESALPAVRAECRDLHRLGAEQIADRVDAVDPDIVERASAQLARVEPDVPILHGHGEHRIEETGLTQLPALNDVDRLEVRLLEMQPVGDHELDVVLFGGPNHGPAILFRDRHGLLAEHMDAGPRRPLTVFPMQMVGQRDVYGVYQPALEALVVLFVGKAVLDFILAAQLLQLVGITGDQGRELRIFRVGEGRQYRYLSDMAEANDRIADFFAWGGCFAGHW